MIEKYRLRATATIEVVVDLQQSRIAECLVDDGQERASFERKRSRASWTGRMSHWRSRACETRRSSVSGRQPKGVGLAAISWVKKISQPGLAATSSIQRVRPNAWSS